MIDITKFIRSGKTFVGEMSDFNGERVFEPVECFGKTYFDVHTINPATKHVAVWEIIETVRDAEGGVLKYELEPTIDTLDRFPKLNKWSMVIYND